MSDIHLDSPVNALASFHYFSNVDMAQIASWGIRIIGDSGAYSAAAQGTQVDRAEFYEWARKWKKSLFWTAGLDVIGNDKATYLNWVNAPSDIRLVPTVHYGVKPDAIDKYVEADVDLIGLGGMVPHKSEPERLLRWCGEMMRYARDKHPQVRFHGWGVTHPRLMMSLPWWSVDSSGYSASFRFGRMALFDTLCLPPKRRSVALDGKSIAEYATLLKTVYGVDWKRVATSDGTTRRDVGRTSIRTYQLMEQHLRRRFKVSCPESLKSSDDIGPTIFSVATTESDLEMFRPSLSKETQ